MANVSENLAKKPSPFPKKSLAQPGSSYFLFQEAVPCGNHNFQACKLSSHNHIKDLLEWALWSSVVFLQATSLQASSKAPGKISWGCFCVFIDAHTHACRHAHTHTHTRLAKTVRVSEIETRISNKGSPPIFPGCSRRKDISGTPQSKRWQCFYMKVIVHVPGWGFHLWGGCVHFFVIVDFRFCALTHVFPVCTKLCPGRLPLGLKRLRNSVRVQSFRLWHAQEFWRRG